VDKPTHNICITVRKSASTKVAKLLGYVQQILRRQNPYLSKVIRKNIMIMIVIIISSILIYFHSNSTAKGPITKCA
jgi:hypothetical protein